MNVRVLFFASLREKVKKSETRQTMADGATVGDLWVSLCREHATLEPMTASVSFAVNREYATRDVVLKNDDEVALIPPVSGGR
jgi:molybdopterin converting factor subunit 1